MDISKITNPEVKAFLAQFARDRGVNTEYYKRVPEDKLDFRMVDTPERKSDSPRESMIHQIATTRKYIDGAKSGVLRFDIQYNDLVESQKLTKEDLLQLLQKTEEDLVEVLADPEIGNKKARVPWSDSPIPAVAALWGLDSHEILHQGWNLALMDHLNIERFPALKEIWG